MCRATLTVYTFQKHNIKPENYMMLIFNLTQDYLRIPDEYSHQRVKAMHNKEYVRAEQILTEQGICYISNHYLASNLSVK